MVEKNLAAGVDIHFCVYGYLGWLSKSTIVNTSAENTGM